MLRLLSIVLGMMCVSAGPALATSEAPPLSLDDFSVGRLLHAPEPGGLQSVLLDLEVYERSVERELADLRVFDAQGRAVPYAIRRRLPERGSRTKSAFQSLPLFRLDARPPGASALSQGDYRIDAELSESGAIVRVFRGDGSAAETQGTTPWLLDASGLKRPIVGLEFDFEPGPEDLVSRVLVEASNDLAHWKSVRADIVVARLAQEGHRIERLRFDLPTTRSKYLRLTPAGQATLPLLREVRVRPTDVKRGERLPTEHKSVLGKRDPESRETVLFDLAGAPSVESIQVVLPTPGSLVEGRIESSENPDGPWTRRGNELVYHYQREGITFQNPKIEWSGRRHRYLRFISSNRGGGLQGEIPQLEIEWVPDQLLYLDRGDGPSTLAIGRLGAVDASFTPDQLLRTMRGRGEDLREATAQLGEERVLAGPIALEPPPEPVPWRTYGLWALLIGIVGIVLSLGLRLLRTSEADA